MAKYYICTLHVENLKLTPQLAASGVGKWRRPELVVTRPVLRESKHGSLRDHRPQPAGSGARPSAAAMGGDGVRTGLSAEKGVPPAHLPAWRQFTEEHNR
jgi:hypothetical protein